MIAAYEEFANQRRAFALSTGNDNQYDNKGGSEGREWAVG